MSLRIPVRATLRPMSVQASSSVVSRTESVPAKLVCSGLKPTLCAGSASSAAGPDKRSNAARTMPSLMTASVESGRWGPCCSIAATGRSATVSPASTRPKSVVVRSCQYPLRTAPLSYVVRGIVPGCPKRRQPWIMLGSKLDRAREETAMSTVQRAVVTDNEVKELIAKARKAQAVYEAFSQEQVDAIVRDMA